MALQSPDYKRLFLEEQRRRQEAERAQEEAKRAQEEAERAQEEAERAQEEAERAQEEAERAQEEEQHRRENAEEKTRKTTLPEFLDACHVHLHSGLTVQTATLSTRGDPANANYKHRPERIRAWEEFPVQQEAIWNCLMRSNFILQRHFTSSHTLEESGEAIRQRMMSSELDLNHFERSTVEDHISSIIKQLYCSPTLRRKFRLKGTIKFENHANTLTPERQMEGDMQQMSLSGNPRRRSPRLLSQANRTETPESTEPTESAATAAAVSRCARPRADQFCVYNTSTDTQNTEHRVAAFIIEYKAPHKLSLGYIYEGLNNMELKEVVRRTETDSPQDHYRRLIAAIITQAFSYMVQAGLEYGYICTGEAFIFLRVPDDPRTVYYFLSVPQGDVGGTTGWASDSDGENRLHLTAVGQVLAFTLQALKTPPRDQNWRTNAAAQLEKWQVVYDDLLDTIPTDNVPSSEYRPPKPDENEFLRMSPIRLRPRVASSSSPDCHPPQGQSQSSDDEFDPKTPSRASQPTSLPPSQPLSQALSPAGRVSSDRDSYHEGRGGQYCTQKCLQGLVEGGLLDKMCPNVRYHGESHHRIDQPTFIILMRQQLSKDLDTNCQPVGIHGSRGALFKVRLGSYGYTLAAKCTVIDFVGHLKREAAIYERLRPIQGIHVPVYLGNMDLDRPYFYDGIAEIVHMMFLSFGGTLIHRHIKATDEPYLNQRVERSIRAIHQLGVLHRDVMPRNMLWNAEVGQVMMIDFERAEILKSRAALGVISPNRKRKRVTQECLNKQLDDGCDAFVREMNRAIIELRWGLYRCHFSAYSPTENPVVV